MVASPLILALGLALPGRAGELSIPHEQFVLDNGLTVILHRDPSLPQVVVDTWYGVGSKDEVAGRTGFAHLFEHLMFMGTTRLPGSGFDDRMEAVGGWNNAWTSEDATNYYDVGGSQILDLLLWMEADRMEGLGRAMDKRKLALQRDVVRNERRQSVEDEPYGEAWEALSAALFPPGHPYSHSVIGTHEDLQAATVDDVTGFFGTWYVPNNARLVVAGDFDPVATRATITRLFGGIPRVELPARQVPEPVDLPTTARLELTDQVSLPASMLAWHTDPALTDGDAVMDVLATLLATGRSSRLYSALVHEQQIATQVEAWQMSQMLGSVFLVFALGQEGGDLAAVEAAVQAEIDRLASEGPTEDELVRARNTIEMGTLGELESLMSRAENLARYHYLKGQPDWLAEDMARTARVTAADVQAAAARLSLARRHTMRVTPAPDAAPAAQEP